MISKEQLLQEAKISYHKPEILEKVYRLLLTLEQFMLVPYLQKRLVLKGGTALNLFCFNEVPRMSVDIDLNYMYRKPLWPISWISPKIDFDKKVKVPVLDIHELAAGKLSALFSRKASRDLFDAHHLLTKCQLDIKKLRLAFVIYLAMTNIDLASLTARYIDYDLTDMRNRLMPVLRQKNIPRMLPALKIWASKLLEELQQSLDFLVPLKTEEIDFISEIRKNGKIKPALITDDVVLTETIFLHPAIQWAANKSSLDLVKAG